MMKAAILLGAALVAFWVLGPIWPEEGGGATTQGGCDIDPNGHCRP